MKISKVGFENFKPYYDSVNFDLSVDAARNVVLIGGRNGQGKTSFLLGIVWCLYGENIDKVDEVFKKEIKGSYQKFLKNSINWQAHTEGKNTFTVRVTFSEVELSECLKAEQLPATVELVRTFNLDEPIDSESFEIFVDGHRNGLINEASDKVNFVNDYLIPIDIAKFVFFDAEKIADLASLGARDQAVLINQAFNQILGLSIYENLVDDLEEFGKELSKREAKGDLMLQIASFESAIKGNQAKISQYEGEQQDIDEQLIKNGTELKEATFQLYKRGDISLKNSLDEVKAKKQKFSEHLDEVKIKFHEAAELIPFAILTPHLSEANDHIQKESELQKKEYLEHDLKEKTKELAERLFNKPPFPEEDLEMEVKLFYYKKAQAILSEMIKPEQDEQFDLQFTHDLDKSEIQHVGEVLQVLNSYNRDTFENVFSEYIRITNDLIAASTELKKIETFNEDEFVADLQNQKKKLEEEKSSLERRKGGIENEIIRLQGEIKQNQSRLATLLDKVNVSKETEKQKQVLDNYIKTLREFIQQQKQKKKAGLQNNLLAELKRLINKPSLVSEVEVEILSNNLGLEIKLYSSNKKETNPSTDMSKGEQQLYISALMKSILSESVYDLPVFIDTPLGRLDQEHRDNILSLYYPELSEQVVILSTNTEIRASDLPKIEQHIAKLYKLENRDNKTQLLESYFTTA